MRIGKAAVIGAGTMGSGIACHLANAGVPCLLLDIVPGDLSPEERNDPQARSRLARQSIERALKAKPPPFMDPRDADLLEAGNVEDHLERLSECDWVIEAVTENLEIKRDLFRRIAAVRRPGTIVSSNTSGLSLKLLAEGLDEDFRRSFLITHFFNPPRYMYLLEIVKGEETLDEVVEAVERFAEVRLGKGVVRAKDTPNFIANRIGVFAMGAACRFLVEEGLTVEEADAVTGPVLGRPKTATFRLHDLVGIDVALMVMENVRRLLPDDESREFFEPPAFLKRMVEEGKLGRKTGAGFYKKTEEGILVLDLETFEYRPQREVRFESLEAARKEKTLRGRIRTLVSGEDKGARYARRVLTETLLYAARRIPEIADDIVSVDRAMRWGFNWELGPFETWDVLGVRETAERLEGEGKEMPPLVRALLDKGFETFYAFAGEGAERRRVYFDLPARDYTPVPARPGVILLDDVRERSRPVRSNAYASLWDLGDGVLGLEFHSKMNSIHSETLELILEAADLVEAEDYAGLVIGNQAPNFSVGANLVELSAAAREKRFDAIDAMIRRFHRVALRLRYLTKPAVAVVQGMALGGGCEIPLACDRVQAAAETYMGLVELGVGLIPAGGGTREMACRAAEAVPPGVEADFFPFLKRAFEVIAQAKTSQSAEEARALGFLRNEDGISMNRDRALADAKRTVLHLVESGYRPPRPRKAVRVAGEPGYAEFQVLIHQYRQAGYATEYDAYLARKLAYVLCGGEVDAEFTATEEYLLDLEREVFLSLVGEPKTLERIEHTLKTGKPLRN